MTLRLVKIVVLLSYGLLIGLDSLDNMLEPAAGFTEVSHVMSMDTTGDNGFRWRGIENQTLQYIAYGGMIAAQLLAGLLILWGGVRMLRALRGTAAAFEHAKNPGYAGLGLSIAIWLGGFVAIGGFWFMMWLSPTYNALNGSLLEAVLAGLALIIVMQRETDSLSG